MKGKIQWVAVLTGDIINSRFADPSLWLPKLKETFNHYGSSSKHWEIYRGDSFQILLDPLEALSAVFLIKATIKQFKGLDIRIGIGIGELTFQSNKITESNGSAFLNSGKCFDSLKKQTLAIKTPWVPFDNTLNLMLELITLTIDKWTEAGSAMVFTKLLNPEMNQIDLAEKLNIKSQGAISEGLQRAAYDEIQKLILYYREQIQSLC